MRYVILAILLLSSCSGQPAPQPPAPVTSGATKGGDASAGQSTGLHAVAGAASAQNTPVTLSVLIGPIAAAVECTSSSADVPGNLKPCSVIYQEFSGKDYTEGSTKQWIIRTLPWPCEQPPVPNVHVIVKAEQVPGEFFLDTSVRHVPIWKVDSCIGDNYYAPFPAEWEEL